MLLVVGGALALLIVRLRATYSVIRVDGDSMAPTLADGDRVLVRRVAGPALRRGQIAVVRAPPFVGETFLIKRIVGLPGDPVPPSVAPVVAEERIPVGNVVLLGDNGEDSFDSRDHGYFPLADVHAITRRRLSPGSAGLSVKETA
ncbi:signal peptidase I [Nonomuraea sp. NPDC050643]|uniref:signal peptidase I n=1 Tax=Nonomuraea sp. NPDC050643 TaxID=3155660 RepID=UPI0033F1244D